MAKSFQKYLMTLFLVVIGGLTSSLNAQNRTVIGVVKDDSGEALMGAFVVQEGTSNGVSTDLDGRYTITLPDKSVNLQFQFIGYVTKTVTVPAN